MLRRHTGFPLSRQIGACGKRPAIGEQSPLFTLLLISYLRPRPSHKPRIVPMPSTSDNKRIAKNTLMLYFRMILIMGISLYTSRVVLNVLGVVDYGVYNVVGGMVTLFAFLNTALAQASQRYIAFGIEKDPIEKQRQTFSMLLNVHLLIAAIIVLLCESVGLWLFYNELVIPADRLKSAFWVMQCSIVSMAVTVTQVPYNASIYGHERMGVYAYISIIEGALQLVAVFSLKYFFADKLLSYGILMMAVSFIIALTYRMYCHYKLPNCRYILCWSKGLFKEVGSYTSWSLIGNLAWTLNSQGMNFLINIFFGPVYNATRGIASRVESAVTSFLTNFLGASIPAIIKSYAAGDVQGTIKLAFKSTKIGFLLFMCLSLPLISIIDNILDIWLVTPPPQCGLFCVLSLIYIQCNSFGGTLQNVVQATGKIRNYQLCYGSLKILAIPVAYILYKLNAPVITYLWVLITFSLLGLMVQLAVIRTLVPGFRIWRYFTDVFKPVVSAYVVPMMLSIMAWKHHFELREAIFVCLLDIILCIAAAWTIGLTKNERQWIMSVVRNKFKR